MPAAMRKKFGLLVLALVASVLLPQAASAARTARILVHFDRHVGAAGQQALIGGAGGRRVATVHRLGTAVVNVPAAEKWQAVAQLRRQAGVSYAEVDRVVHAYAVSINDPFSIAPYPTWPFTNPFFPDAWSLALGGSDVTVAVLDTGVQADHPDLLGKLVSGYDIVNADNDPADDNTKDGGHGTLVSGVIAAQENNGIGIAGVCWKCRIMPVKVLDSTGSGSDSGVASGITWAVDHGAEVINLSLGGPGTTQTLTDAVSYALAYGVVVVAAAGNDGEDAALATTPNYPAAYSGVISVGAVNESNSRYAWSNHGSWVQVDAPGCTDSTGLGSVYLGNFCGTSTASPFVAGLAGLALSYRPAASASSVVSAIEQSAQLLTSGNSVHGLIDADCALQRVASVFTCVTASFGSSVLSGVAPLSVTFNNASTNATSYTWAFGDGTSSTAASPTHTFTAAGSYDVTLTASDASMSRLARATITVAAPAPVAAFTASKSSGRAPLSVTFSNASANATSYAWSFGDGSAGSTDASPTHIFERGGNFSVTLTASGPGGTATATRTISVSRPLPDLALSLSRKASRLKSGYRLSSFVIKLRNSGDAADGRVKVTIRLPA
ncbi:MAG: S8 family serine peptidase, partial [Gaiellaceae bacterium]